MNDEHLHFVTGRLAEGALRRTVAELAEQLGFAYSIDVLPITVAALMTPAWIAKRIDCPASTTRILVPGYCDEEVGPIEQATGKPVERGPRDLRRLPQHFGRAAVPPDYGEHQIEIIAEINHCPRLELDEICRQAKRLAADGADYIDIGCLPGAVWSGLGDAVRAVRDLGLRVSIDSLNPTEIAAGVAAGAELVLSVNSSNRDAALDWGCEVIAIPDDPKSLKELDNTVEHLAKGGVPLRIDPILEPIGFGFAESLGRYLEIRRRYADAEMMMGVGNLTELTEVDSAGVNTLLLGFCEETRIRSVLTTQVIPWAQSSVKECDLGRRLVHHAVENGVPPKHLDAGLVMLRDATVSQPRLAELKELASSVRDHNYRLFATNGADTDSEQQEVHLIGPDLHLHNRDPFRIAQQLQDAGAAGTARPLDPGHAFYLGYELAKASTALTLGKHYEQDEPLDWGFLTTAEESHYLQKRRRAMPSDPSSADVASEGNGED